MVPSIKNLSTVFLALSLIIWPHFSQAEKHTETEIETIVVTGSRWQEKHSEIPQQITVISSTDIERTIGFDVTDILKKDALLDVVQYPGALSGVSIRGFSPETFGINRHSLLLVDGRPAGTTNLATLPLLDIERIEVLRGPASAMYGGQAMGGVINLITKKAGANLAGQSQLGFGSYYTTTGNVSFSGPITSRLGLNVNAGTEVQPVDITMGNGKTRQHTQYKKYYGSTRLEAQISDNWRLEARGDLWIGQDIETPGDEADGEKDQGFKDIERFGGELSAQGEFDKHSLRIVGFFANEHSTNHNEPQTESAFKSSENEYQWFGAQIRDAIQLDNHRLTLGFDFERVRFENRRYLADKQRTTPYFPDNRRDSFGSYAQMALHFLEDRLMGQVGVRWDHIVSKTFTTKYREDFTPDSSSLNALNPSAGLNFELIPGWRLHSTVGRAFVPPTAYQVAGTSEQEGTEGTVITKGNADLLPEESWSVDGGLSYQLPAWGVKFNATYFYTTVDNKIEEKKVTDTYTTYINIGNAKIHGLESEFALDVGAVAGWHFSLRPFVGMTRIFKAEQTTEIDGTRDILNVAELKINYGIEFDYGQLLNAKLNARYRGKLKERDWDYYPNYREFDYPTWTLLDLSVSYQPFQHHLLTGQVGNIFDKYYYEKRGYGLAGRTFYVKYTYVL